MIKAKWKDPNFKFRALDIPGKVYEYFCYAESEDALRRRLEGKNMIVEWVEPYDFDEWRKRAKAATEQAVRAYDEGKKPIKFNGKIWAELKWHLFELFKGKCAYCESKPQNVAYGDVEHYRPKAKVQEDKKHPGYYWLAYDETNLLPSCTLCNQPPGKMNRFPVDGNHALASQEIPAERPWLLHPYDEQIDPSEHLEFGDIGEARALNNSLYGEYSWRCYNLNRPGLGEARRTALARVRQDWHMLVGVLSSLKIEDVYETCRRNIAVGDREYSAAQMCELRRIINREMKQAQAGALGPQNPAP